MPEESKNITDFISLSLGKVVDVKVIGDVAGVSKENTDDPLNVPKTAIFATRNGLPGNMGNVNVAVTKNLTVRGNSACVTAMTMNLLLNRAKPGRAHCVHNEENTVL